MKGGHFQLRSPGGGWAKFGLSEALDKSPSLQWSECLYPQSSYAEILTVNVMVLEGGAFGGD